MRYPLTKQKRRTLSVKQARKNNSGLSLAELVIALALVAIIFVSLVQVLITGHFAITQGNEIVTASNLAEEFLERCRGLSYTDLPDSGNFDGKKGDMPNSSFPKFPPLPYPEKKFTDTTYYFTAEIYDLPSTDSSMKRIDITVKWNSSTPFNYGGKGKTDKTRSITFTTLLTKY